jgi:NTE family protein
MSIQTPIEDQSFWHDLGEAIQTEIKHSMRARRMARGETLIEKGADSDRLFIVNFGQFGVCNAKGGEIVAEIGKDQLIGEMGFFTGERRSAHVVAMRDSEVLEIDRAEFESLVSRIPEVQVAIVRSLARRLSRLGAISRRSARQSSPPRVFVALPIGSGDMLPTFFERLSRSIAARRSCRLLSAADAMAHFGGRELDRYSIADWLGELERDHDLVVCVADDALSEWTRAILHSADQLLLVAAGEAREPGAVESFAFDLLPPARRRFVKLYERRPPACVPAAPWLKSRQVFMTHHVVVDDGADYDSLARFLVGQAIGFIGGAGGALGIAHIGVYRAFLEHGVVFDICGGSSIGSGMAAAFSQLKSPKEVEDGIHDIFVKHAALKKLTFPRYGLLDHTILESTLEESYGDIALEDLWRPCFAIATDLSDYTMRVMRTGPVWQAVRASCAIPGVLPPFLDDDGHLLVDGAVSDNVPTAAMHALKSGPNLAVDLRTLDTRTYDFSYRSIPGRFELLRRLLNPFKRSALPQCPGPAAVIQQSIFSNIREKTESADASDLLLRPPVCPGSSFMTWDRHAEVVEHAYKWTLQAIEELKAEDSPILAEMQRLSRPS